MCVYRSAIRQVQVDRMADLGIVAENAFMACQTEERAIAAALAAFNAGPGEIEQALVSIRLYLKKTIRQETPKYFK